MSRPQIKKARDRARQVITEYRIVQPAIPVEDIATNLGLKVTYSQMDDEISGMIYPKDGKTIVGINSRNSRNRQRFTLAHECGHFLLHREKIVGSIHVDKKYPGLLRSDISSQGVDPIEIEANQFAAELLVPESMLIGEINHAVIDIEDDEFIDRLAKRFKVSKQMMSNCLSNLRTH